MSTRNLDTKHPDFEETEDARSMSRIFHSGDKFKTEDPQGLKYLLREPNETLEDDGSAVSDFKVRLKRATLDNYVGKIVTARQALLFKDEHDRSKLPESMKAVLDNVDLKGGSADVFFEHMAYGAQVDGIAWVEVDMPKIPEGLDVRTRRDELELGMRPFFTRIPGTNVIDWEVGEDGLLNWIVISQSRPLEREEPGHEKTSVSQWKVWYRDRWEILEEVEGDAQDGQPQYQVYDEGPNDTGVVPMIPFFGVKYTEHAGWPVCKAVLSHIRLILNKKSELDRIERLKTEPIPVIISPKRPERIKATGGLWIESSEVGSAQISAAYLEPAGDGLSQNRASIDDLVGAIFSIALAQAKRDTAQVESADAQREQRRSFTSSLKSASREYEKSEERCWRVWALWTGDTTPIDVGYSRDFADEAIDSAMLQVLNALAEARRLTDRTLLLLLQRSGRLPSTIDIEDELKQLQKEKDEAEAKFASSLLGGNSDNSDPVQEEGDGATGT